MDELDIFDLDLIDPAKVIRGISPDLNLPPSDLLCLGKRSLKKDNFTARERRQAKEHSLEKKRREPNN